MSEKDLKAMLSVLADDEAGDVGVRRILAEMNSDPQVIRESWGAYHLMRESLTHGDTILCSADFLVGVQRGIRAASLSQTASAADRAGQGSARHDRGAWQQDGRPNLGHTQQQKPKRQPLSALWEGFGRWQSLATAGFMLVAVAIVAVVVAGSQQPGMADFANNAEPKSAAQETPISGQQAQTDVTHVADLGGAMAGNSGRAEDGSRQPGIDAAGNSAAASPVSASVASVQADAATDSARGARGEVGSARIPAGVNGTVSQRFVADRLNSYKVDHSNRRLPSVGFIPFITIVTDFRARPVNATSAQHYGRQELRTAAPTDDR